jgi:hypothetical protein
MRRASATLTLTLFQAIFAGSWIEKSKLAVDGGDAEAPNRNTISRDEAQWRARACASGGISERVGLNIPGSRYR